MRHEKTADEEANHGNERGELEVGKAGDHVTTRAAACPPCAEADEEAVANDDQRTGGRSERAPRDELRREEACKVG